MNSLQALKHPPSFKPNHPSYLVFTPPLQSFADAVIDVISDAKEGDDQPIEKTLEAANKVLDAAELDFSRYGDVLFEVAFAGARLASGGSVATEGEKLPFNVCFSHTTHIFCFFYNGRLVFKPPPAPYPQLFI